MADWPALSTEELDGFASRGYVVCPAVLPPAMLDALHAEINALVARCKRPREPAFKALGSAVAMQGLRESCMGSHCFGASAAVVDTIGHGLHNDAASTVYALCAQPALASMLSRFVAVPVVCMSKAILKPASKGSKVPAHADDQYFYTSPASGMTLWFALEDATEANGCIEVLPASHLAYKPAQRFARGGDAGKARWAPPPPPAMDDEAWRIDFPAKSDALPWEPLPVRAGAMIAMDRRLLHRSGANRSGESRRALTLHVFVCSIFDRALTRPASRQLKSVDGACVWDEADNWIPAGALRRL